MISNENRFLIKFLFPNIDCLMFFKEQLFDELKLVLPKNLCYSNNNKNSKARQANKLKCLNLIVEFFAKNKAIAEETQQAYNKPIDSLAEDILQGFVFFLNPNSNPLEDKKSVCFVEGINLKDVL